MLASASASAWHAMEVGQFAIAAPLDSPDARTQYIGIGTSGCRSWSVASVASKDLSNKRRLLISRNIPAAQERMDCCHGTSTHVAAMTTLVQRFQG